MGLVCSFPRCSVRGSGLIFFNTPFELQAQHQSDRENLSRFGVCPCSPCLPLRPRQGARPAINSLNTFSSRDNFNGPISPSAALFFYLATCFYFVSSQIFRPSSQEIVFFHISAFKQCDALVVATGDAASAVAAVIVARGSFNVAVVASIPRRNGG